MPCTSVQISPLHVSYMAVQLDATPAWGCVCCNLICIESPYVTGVPNLQVDAKMMFGDRLLHITLARVWAALSTWEKMKLVWTLVHEGVSMPDKDELKEELESMKVLYC